MKHYALFLMAFGLLAACTPSEPAPDQATADSLAIAEPTERSLFAGYDGNPNTSFSKDEFALGLDSTEFVVTYDANGDGVLDEAEFTTTYAAAGYDAQASFAAYDMDGDGLVTPEELAVGLFSALDTNGDGSIDAVEFSHFTAVTEGHSEGF